MSEDFEWIAKEVDVISSELSLKYLIEACERIKKLAIKLDSEGLGKPIDQLRKGDARDRMEKPKTIQDELDKQINEDNRLRHS